MKRLLYLLFLAMLSVPAAAQSEYWQKVPSPAQEHLLSVDFGSSQVGYIAGTGGTLLRTLDGGISWNTLAFSGITLNAASPDIIHVNFLSPASGFAISGNREFPVYRGTVYKTADSGKTWTQVNIGNVAAARSYFFDTANGFVVGSAFFSGYNVVRQNAGVWGPERWFSFDPSNFLYGIDFRNRNTGIVGGDGGLVYRTFDGGAHWDTVKTVVDSTINAVRFLNDKTVIAGSDNNGGAILISEDTGRTWDIETSTLTFSYPDIKDIAASARDSFIAVGHAAFGPSGIILWHDGIFMNNRSTSEPLNALSMRDAAVAFIVGDSGAIYSNRLAVLNVPQGRLADRPLLYPNPAGNEAFTEAAYPHRVSLRDATGRLVIVESSFRYRHSLQLEGVPRGVYLVESLGTAGQRNVQRLLIR